MKQSAANPEPLIARMASLSEPARLRILHLLERQPLLVNDLAEVLQLPQSTVSRHLKQLSEQGWLVSHREGTSHQYRMLANELSPEARKLWDLAREQTAAWPAVAQDRLRLASVVANRQRDSRSFFAGAARDWDRLRVESFGTRFTLETLTALIDPGLTIADLGCGTGAILELLAPQVKRVIGIDNSEDMLLAARKRVRRFDNIALEQGDITALPLADKSIDAAVCVLALSYVTDVPAALREIHRTLTPGGRAVIVDVLPHDREEFRRQMGQARSGFELESLQADLQKAGLSVQRLVPLDPEPATRGPALFIAIAGKR